MVKVFSREIETASANPMLLMKPVVIYVLDVGVRTITRPKGPARAFTQNDMGPPVGFDVQDLTPLGLSRHEHGALGQNI